MFLELISNAPALAVAWLMAIIVALTVHEFSHALAAKLRGDLTAEREGRLTLNPISHIDPIGFIPLLLLGFGWAKPVPFNPYNLKNQKWDSVIIALAGPASNLVVAAIAAIALRALLVSGTVATLNLLVAFLFLSVVINLFLLFFNIVPVHPLDGSKLFFALFDAPKYEQLRLFVATRGPHILMFLVFLSFLGFNVFFFVSAPSFATCDVLIGDSCQSFFYLIFAGI